MEPAKLNDPNMEMLAAKPTDRGWVNAWFANDERINVGTFRRALLPGGLWGSAPNPDEYLTGQDAGVVLPTIEQIPNPFGRPIVQAIVAIPSGATDTDVDLARRLCDAALRGLNLGCSIMTC